MKLLAVTVVVGAFVGYMGMRRQLIKMLELRRQRKQYIVKAVKLVDQ